MYTLTVTYLDKGVTRLQKLNIPCDSIEEALRLADLKPIDNTIAEIVEVHIFKKEGER